MILTPLLLYCSSALQIRVDVEYAFFHCAKAYMRSQLWDPTTWPAEPMAVSFGQYFAEDEAEAAMIDERVADTYSMVKQAVNGEVAEGYPPVTVVENDAVKNEEE